MNYKYILAFVTLLIGIEVSSFSQIELSFHTATGKVLFESESTLETIQASSDELKGILNPNNSNFAFVVRIVSFKGFNSTLQKDHFNENYLESEHFPNATFQGKLIDDFDFSKDGTATVRAKGILKIHGEEQERIIKVTLQKKGNSISVQSTFSILLSDYEIRIPRIVHGKISPEIVIHVNLDLVKK
ncbi:MAG: YceI family protein [Bacteroidetes bacterium]|nr:YceI family protein [Bacteroidota bacterium]